MKWLYRLWPWHEHVYSMRWNSREFECRCGHTISGEELFKPDTMLGRYWREHYQ